MEKSLSYRLLLYLNGKLGNYEIMGSEGHCVKILVCTVPGSIGDPGGRYPD